MQPSLRTLVSRAFDATDWDAIPAQCGVQIASNKLWLSDRQRAVIELAKKIQLTPRTLR